MGTEPSNFDTDRINEQFNEHSQKAEETLKDHKKTESTLCRAWEKLKENTDKGIKAVKEDICLFFEVIYAYITGSYTKIPFKTLAMILGAVTYFSWPADIIFDIIPVIGFLDDVFVISMTLKFAHDDLQNFKAWKAARAEAKAPQGC